VSKWFFNIFVVCSTILLLLFLATCLFAGNVDPIKRHLSLSHGCHLSIDTSLFGPSFEIFNDADYGPYRGSIIEVTGPRHSLQVKATGFIFPGIYYRLFRWPNGTSLWTVSLSLVYPLLFSAILPVVAFARYVRRRREIGGGHS
jgi:hypothetical protein